MTITLKDHDFGIYPYGWKSQGDLALTITGKDKKHEERFKKILFNNQNVVNRVSEYINRNKHASGMSHIDWDALTGEQVRAVIENILGEYQ